MSEEKKKIGRPPIYNEPMVIRPVSLPATYWQYLMDELADSYAAAIRRLIEEHQERKRND